MQNTDLTSSQRDFSSSLFRVVLVQPEIPQNTGNIGRTCVGLNSSLELIGPLGFEISNARLKRAGLDYWPDLLWQQYPSWEIWSNLYLKTEKDRERTFYFSAKAEPTYYSIPFKRGDRLIFGCETKGLPDSLLEEAEGQVYQLPMPGKVRGYNLATAVAIALFEAYRQVVYQPEK